VEGSEDLSFRRLLRIFHKFFGVPVHRRSAVWTTHFSSTPERCFPFRDAELSPSR
jgi:hypothetical protein